MGRYKGVQYDFTYTRTYDILQNDKLKVCFNYMDLLLIAVSVAVLLNSIALLLHVRKEPKQAHGAKRT